MFSKKDRIQENRVDISNYVDGFDVFNSKLLLILNDPNIPKEDYVINTYEYRPDLIAKDIYGDSSYLGILLFTNATGLEYYKKGTVLQIIPKPVLNAIFNVL